MRYVRRASLLIAAIAAAMGLIASVAMATPISVVNEATGQPCGNVSLNDHTVVGGCTTHITGADIELEAEIFGFHVHEDTCNTEFHFTLNSTGGGFLHGFNISGCEAGIVPCDAEAGETHAGRPSNPWPVSATETAVETTTLSVSMCILTGIGECEGNLPMTMYESGGDGAETYVANVSETRLGSSACEFDGTWTMEGTERIHINHIHPPGP